MASIAPYTINSPLPNGMTSNLLFSDVWQGTLNLPVISVGDQNSVSSLIILHQSNNYTFKTRITDPTLRFTKVPYTAGTAGVYTLSLASVVPVVGQMYILKLYGGSATNPYQAQVQATATTTSASDLSTALNNAITNAGQSSYFTAAVVGGNTIQITEASAATGGFTSVFLGSSLSTWTTNTANVQPFGTLAQVQLYKPSITSGTFNLYQWSYDVSIPNTDGDGMNKTQREFIQIWIDLAATNYATADTQMQQFQTGTYWASSYSTVQMNNYLGIPA